MSDSHSLGSKFGSRLTEILGTQIGEYDRTVGDGSRPIPVSTSIVKENITRFDESFHRTCVVHKPSKRSPDVLSGFLEVRISLIVSHGDVDRWVVAKRSKNVHLKGIEMKGRV